MNFDNYFYKNDITEDTEPSLGYVYEDKPEDIVEFALLKDTTFNNNQNIPADSTSNEDTHFTENIVTTTYDTTLTKESLDSRLDLQKFKVTEHELQDKVENVTTIGANYEDITESQVKELIFLISNVFKDCKKTRSRVNIFKIFIVVDVFLG